MGSKRVTTAKIPTKGDDYCDVFIDQMWKQVIANTITCGQEKDVKYSTKTGLSKEDLEKADNEISAKLNFGISSLSAKLSEGKQTTFSITREQTIEEKITIKSPKCGMTTFELFQLNTAISIEDHVTTGKLRKKEETKMYQYFIPESEFYSRYDETENIPDCGKDCKPETKCMTVVYDFPHSYITMLKQTDPTKFQSLGNRIASPQVKPSAQYVSAAEVPSKLRKSLRLSQDERGRRTTIVGPMEIGTETEPPIYGLSYKTFRNKKQFDELWVNVAPSFKDEKIKKDKAVLDFNLMNWHIHQSKYHHLQHPTKGNVLGWF